MPNDALMELVSRLSGKVIISSEITEGDVSGVDRESLIANIVERSEKAGMKVVGKKELGEIIFGLKEKKEPVQIEVIRSADFKPAAKEVTSRFRIREARIERTTSGVSDFVACIQDRFRRLREIIRSHGMSGTVGSLESIKQYMNGRELAVIWMVYDKITTKKGHILVTLEDENGTAKVLFIRPERKIKDSANELFDNASKLIKDDIIAVNGKVSDPFIIANRLLWPDVPIHHMNSSEDDVAVALISDIHIGHKLFMEKSFGKLLEWMNGNVDSRKDLARKLKYLVIGGDVVDGIGIYPEQEKELNIDDIYKQYAVFYDFMESVPDYVEVFLMAGNHDAVQRAEPQPRIGNGLLKDFNRSNIHVVTNPCYLNLDKVKILSYHGASLDSVIRGVPGCSYNTPTDAMKEILKRRHLSPIYGGNVVVPGKIDPLIIDEVPDILHMGHIHKNGYDDYHGTKIVNSGTWQSRTSYQIKQGHIPIPALLTVYEMKSMRLNTVDFAGGSGA
jgi:DNA polymerase II small subunit